MHSIHDLRDLTDAMSTVVRTLESGVITHPEARARLASLSASRIAEKHHGAAEMVVRIGSEL